MSSTAGTVCSSQKSSYEYEAAIGKGDGCGVGAEVACGRGVGSGVGSGVGAGVGARGGSGVRQYLRNTPQKGKREKHEDVSLSLSRARRGPRYGRPHGHPRTAPCAPQGAPGGARRASWPPDRVRARHKMNASKQSPDEARPTSLETARDGASNGEATERRFAARTGLTRPQARSKQTSPSPDAPRFLGAFWFKSEARRLSKRRTGLRGSILKSCSGFYNFFCLVLIWNPSEECIFFWV